MDEKIIDKILTDLIVKCSNDTLKQRLSKLSQVEKNEKLEGKINPFEAEDYKLRLNQLKEYRERLERYLQKEEPSFAIDNLKEDIAFLEKKIFDYEKRIYRGYDFNKNIDKIPSYNIDDFVQDNIINDTMNDALKNITTFGDVEQAQIDKQEMIDFGVGNNLWDFNSLVDYFDSTSENINSFLDRNYGSNGLKETPTWDYNKQFQDNEYEEYMTKECERQIRELDSIFDNSVGLIQPTVLYHGVANSNIVNIHTRIGDKVDMKSFISASFQEGVGERYGKELGESLPNLYVKFLAPKGTKGICANTDKGLLMDEERYSLATYSFEHEFLFDRGNKGTVVDIDYDTGCVTVLLE